MKRLLILFSFLFVLISQAVAASDNSLYVESPRGLPNTPHLLGLPNDEGPTVVSAAFHLLDISEINDEAETFQFTGLLTLRWKDERSAFDPEKENVQEKVYQGNYQFNEMSPAWYPQVFLVNMSGMFESHGVILRIQPDGTSTLTEMINAVAECDFDMRRYPFDAQRLEAVFGILGFDSSEVVLKTSPALADTIRDSEQISQWQLLDIQHVEQKKGLHLGSAQKAPSSKFIVRVDVKRKPFYVVRLAIIPLALIVILSWSIFWMERSSLGDRISVSFVGILTAVTYQLMISDALPHISYYTFMHGFINFSFLIMCVAALMNIVVGTYDKHGKALIGDKVDYRCRWVFPLVYMGLVLIVVLATFLF